MLAVRPVHEEAQLCRQLDYFEPSVLSLSALER